MAYKRTSYKKRRTMRRRRPRKRSRSRKKISAPARKLMRAGARFSRSSNASARRHRMPPANNLHDYAVHVVHSYPIALVHTPGDVLENNKSFNDKLTLFDFSLDTLLSDGTYVNNIELLGLCQRFREFRVKKLQITLVANPMLRKGLAGPVGHSTRASTGVEDPDVTYATNWGKYAVFPHDPSTILPLTDNTNQGFVQSRVNNAIHQFRKYDRAKVLNHNKSYRITVTPKVQVDQNNTTLPAVNTQKRLITAPWLSIQHASAGVGQETIVSNNTTHYSFAMFSEGTQNSENQYNVGYREYNNPIQPTGAPRYAVHWASFTAYYKVWIEFRGATRPVTNIAI